MLTVANSQRFVKLNLSDTSTEASSLEAAAAAKNWEREEKVQDYIDWLSIQPLTTETNWTKLNWAWGRKKQITHHRWNGFDPPGSASNWQSSKIVDKIVGVTFSEWIIIQMKMTLRQFCVLEFFVYRTFPNPTYMPLQKLRLSLVKYR